MEFQEINTRWMSRFNRAILFMQERELYRRLAINAESRFHYARHQAGQVLHTRIQHRQVA